METPVEDLPVARMCEQGCGSVALVYAMDPAPGGWGGYYCLTCTDALGFRITDRLWSSGTE